jgi:hypothetical protein
MLVAFTEEALRDPVVRAFARKVSLVTYQEYADVLDESPAKVTITLADGRKMERAKYYPTGSVQVPMMRARIEDKFTTCATTLVPLFTPAAGTDRHCVNFPMLAGVLADLDHEHLKFWWPMAVAVLSFAVSIASVVIAYFGLH